MSVTNQSLLKFDYSSEEEGQIVDEEPEANGVAENKYVAMSLVLNIIHTP